MDDFRRLRSWRCARSLVGNIYTKTSRFPKSEMYGLTTQMRRSAVSIAANLAEGAGRGTNADFRRFVEMAAGSAFELETHITIAHDLGFLGTDAHDELLTELEPLQRMLGRLRANLRNRDNP